MIPTPATQGRVVLAGGSGFLGQALAADLVAHGYEVTVLSRSPRPGGAATQIRWDAKSLGGWASSLDGAEAVVNLVGKSVDTRYTADNRREIVESRVDSVRVLGEAVAACARPPRVWVQAASLAIYGDPGDRILDEAAPPGSGFSAETCVLWERAFDSLELVDTRKVILRIGFALGRGGGALGRLEQLTRFYLGGAAGNGRQYISWLHLEDLNRMFRWAIARSELEGVYNATGPSPVSNAQFMDALRAVLHRPWSPPIPAAAVHIGARLMGTEAVLALTGRRCVPSRLVEQGFVFEHPELEPALRDLLG